MKQKISFEKDRHLSKSGQLKIIEILRKEGARNINMDFEEVGSSGERGEGENGTRRNKSSS